MALRQLVARLAYGDEKHTADLDAMVTQWISEIDHACAAMFLYQQPGELPGYGLGLAAARCRYALTDGRVRDLKTMIG